MLHNSAAIKATNTLLKKVIPTLADDIDEGRLDFVLTLENIKEVVHKRGVNLRQARSFFFLFRFFSEAGKRFLGHLFLRVKTIKSKQIILFEMSCRTVKNVMFEKMRQVKSTENSTYLRTICDILNIFFCDAVQTGPRKNNSNPTLSKSQPNWISLLLKTIPNYFEFTRDPTYNDEKFVSRELHKYSFLLGKGRNKILKRVLLLCGVHANNEHISCYYRNKGLLFKPEHILKVDVVVKVLEINQVFDTFQSAGDLEKLYLQELETRKRQLGENHLQIVKVHINLAQFYEKENNVSSACQHWEQAISMVELLRGKASVECIELKIFYGNFLTEVNSEKAEKILLEALNEQVDSEDQMDLLGVFISLANLYTLTLAFDKAVEYFDKALELVEELDYDKSLILHNKAQILFQQEKYEEAKKLYKIVVPLIKHEKGSVSSEYAIALDNFGQVKQNTFGDKLFIYTKNKTYSRLGKFDKAENLLQNALLIKRKALGDRHLEVALSHDHMGSNKFFKVLTDTKLRKNEVMSLIDEAKQCYKKAIELFLRHEPQASLGVTYRNLANIHIYSKEFSQALYYLNKALPLLEDGYDQDTSIVEATRKDIADVQAAGKKLKLFSPISTLKQSENNSFDITSLSPEIKVLKRVPKFFLS